MWTWMKKILVDEATFQQYVRMLVFGAATILPDLIDVGAGGYWGSKVLAAMTLAIKAQSKAPAALPSLLDQVKALPEGDKAMVTALLRNTAP